MDNFFKVINQNLTLTKKVMDFLNSFEFAREELSKNDFKILIEDYVEKIIRKSEEPFEPIIEHLDTIKSMGEIEKENEDLLIMSYGRTTKTLKTASVWANIIEDKYSGKYEIYIRIKPNHMGSDMIDFIEKNEIWHKIKLSKFYKLYEVTEDNERELYHKLYNEIKGVDVKDTLLEKMGKIYGISYITYDKQEDKDYYFTLYRGYGSKIELKVDSEKMDVYEDGEFKYTL